MQRPSSPKRQAKPEAGRGGWFNYYAGYPSAFVRDVIGNLEIEPGSFILDPWLGSGTTTEVAQDLGLRAIGYDINPVMVVVSKARLLGAEVAPSEVSLCQQIVDGARALAVDPCEDPLSLWFKDETTIAVRGLEQSASNLLVRHKSIGSAQLAGQGTAGVSSLAAFFYVALFRTVRELLKPFQSSNPTWVRVEVQENERISSRGQQVNALFWKHVTTMAAAQFQLLPERSGQFENSFPAKVEMGSALSLPEPDDSIDLVLGSPPYCTRIDYAMATYPELATLNYDRAAISSLRRTMMGTATVDKQSPQPATSWGKSANSLLNRVYNHSSRASSTYYYKNMVQYFHALHNCLGEIDRVSKRNGQVVLVTQDSSYKELHVDLPKIVNEMAEILGWSRIHRFNYPSVRHLGRINSKAALGAKSATEAVSFFTT